MFDLLVLVARYFYVILLVCFLLLGIRYIMGERGKINADLLRTARLQTKIIYIFHVVSFLILTFGNPTKTVDFSALTIGIITFILILIVNVLSQVIYDGACPLIWNGMLLLLDIGFVMIQRLDSNRVNMQIFCALLGFVVMFILPFVFKIIPKFEKLEYLYLLASFALLCLVFVFGKEHFGAMNWVSIGGISFQPSEFAKVFFVFYLASALRKKVTYPKLFFATAVSAALVAVLVWHRDLGGALMFFMTYMIVVYVSTGNTLWFILGTSAFSAASVLAFVIFPHLKVRVSVWLNPWADVADKGYQITQSLFAVTTWGPFGSGLTRGVPTKIPVVSKDFMFSAIAEEFGWIFALLIIAIYIMMFYRGVHIALRCKKNFFSLLSVGFTAMLSFQTFVIIAGGLNFIPMTGVTLPFISSGGSSVFISILMIGVLEWLYRSIPREHHEQPALDRKEAEAVVS